MSGDDRQHFLKEREEDVRSMGADSRVQAATREWVQATLPYKYSYNFTWMGLPVVQFPQDLVAMQEVIWEVKPDLIIETGVARGGSMAFYASMLELLGEDGKVVGVDIDLRPHNRAALEAHPLFHRMELLAGSSTAPEVVDAVKVLARGRERILVALDSNHTHQHVLDELRLYGPLVTPGSYMVVFDTIVEELPADTFLDRPWGPGDNPASAVAAFLEESDAFEVDRFLDEKLLITVAQGGFLRCRS